jgi:hypothetical protein
MAPLFGVGNDKVVTGPETSRVETKLTIDVAERTLDVIEDCLDCFEEDDGSASQEVARQHRLPIGVCGYYIWALVVWLAITAVAGVFWVRDIDNVFDCQRTFDACSKADSRPAQACHDLPALVINDFERDTRLACAMARPVRWQGMALWRWLLMLLLFWPSRLLANGIAKVAAVVVSSQALTKHVRQHVSA